MRFFAVFKKAISPIDLLRSFNFTLRRITVNLIGLGSMVVVALRRWPMIGRILPTSA